MCGLVQVFNTIQWQGFQEHSDGTFGLHKSRKNLGQLIKFLRCIHIFILPTTFSSKITFISISELCVEPIKTYTTFHHSKNTR
jgi:hypothetical protein